MMSPGLEVCRPVDVIRGKGAGLKVEEVIMQKPPTIVTAGTTIQGLFEQDQRDQQIDADSLPPAEQQKLRVHSDQREDQVKRLMQNGEIQKPQDFFDAGVILTHSHVPEDNSSRILHSLRRHSRAS
jgi:hypothetical protein